MTGFSDRERRLVESFIWLEWRGKTPVDLGLTWAQVDPGWRRAMLVLKAALVDELQVLRGA